METLRGLPAFSKDLSRILPKRPGGLLRGSQWVGERAEGWSGRDAQRNVLVEHELLQENNQGPEKHREGGR